MEKPTTHCDIYGRLVPVGPHPAERTYKIDRVEWTQAECRIAALSARYPKATFHASTGWLSKGGLLEFEAAYSSST